MQILLIGNQITSRQHRKSRVIGSNGLFSRKEAEQPERAISNESLSVVGDMI
jgi:hypothetical protein